MKKALTEIFGSFWEKTKEAFTPRKPQKKTWIKLAAFVILLALVFCASVVTLSGAVCAAYAVDIVSVGKTPETDGADCILVFGALVRADGTLSDMLRDRVETGVRLYFEGVADKILMSGDSENEDYDETGAMREYAIGLGVPAEDILCDPYGLSTYDSVWRAKNVYGFDSAVLVSQEYHLYRGLFISDRLALDAIGVSADLETYRGQLMRDIREVAARAKDFFLTLTGGLPKYIK